MPFVAKGKSMSEKYHVRAPSRMYISRMDGIRTTDILLVYQYASGGGGNHKIDADDTARRVVILLNAFDDVPTSELSRLTKRAADLAVCTCENPRSDLTNICSACGKPISPNR